MSAVGALDRVALRAALLERWPWVADPERGPSAVDAGECDACGSEPRLVAPCGPPPAPVRRAARARDDRGLRADWALGRRCLVALAAEAFCDGHADEGEAAAGWAAALDEDADLVARLWWVATGEVRLDPALLAAGARFGLPMTAVHPDFAAAAAPPHHDARPPQGPSEAGR